MKKLKVLAIIFVVVLIIAVVAFFILKNEYNKSLEPVNSEENSQAIVIEI